MLGDTSALTVGTLSVNPEHVANAAVARTIPRLPRKSDRSELDHGTRAQVQGQPLALCSQHQLVLTVSSVYYSREQRAEPTSRSATTTQPCSCPASPAHVSASGKQHDAYARIQKEIADIEEHGL